jgi:hypothetical protein
VLEAEGVGGVVVLAEDAGGEAQVGGAVELQVEGELFVDGEGAAGDDAGAVGAEVEGVGAGRRA